MLACWPTVRPHREYAGDSGAAIAVHGAHRPQGHILGHAICQPSNRGGRVRAVAVAVSSLPISEGCVAKQQQA